MSSSSPALHVAVEELAQRYAGELSIAELLCDRHNPASVALLHDTPAGTDPLTFRDLAEKSCNLAAALTVRGIGKGDRVAVLLPRSPELLITLLAIWRAGAVHVPLFTAFGPDAVGYRVGHSAAAAVVTDTGNRGKVKVEGEGDGDGVPRPVVLCLGHGHPGDVDLAAAMDTPTSLAGLAAPGDLAGAAYQPDDPFILLYTSGTTGKAKGVPVPARALASFHAYMHFALDLRPEDVFWNVSDPGWAYGLWYGLVGPLLLGHATILRAGPFDPAAAFDTIERLGVTNLAGSPTFYRALRNHGVPGGLARRTRLRAASSAGEPLGPGVLDWSTSELGTPIHDHYGQSEIGMVIGYARHPQPAPPPRPGAMGHTLPGFTALVLDPDGEPVPHSHAGDLAIDTTASPLFWFTGYHHAADKTSERFPHGSRYYVTGDIAQTDPAGEFVSAVRADDVINSSGYRIGPSDIEDILRTHPAVHDVAVFGVPDPYRGETVTAAIVVDLDHHANDALIAELQALVRVRLGKHLYPRRIMFLDDLPRTASGKIKRAELRYHARNDSPL